MLHLMHARLALGSKARQNEGRSGTQVGGRDVGPLQRARAADDGMMVLYGVMTDMPSAQLASSMNWACRSVGNPG